jgi:hypothetical protein
MANQTVETVNEFGFELIEHLQYSPDLAPSDFHTSGPTKEALRRKIFLSYEEVIGAMHICLKTQPKKKKKKKKKTFFCVGIKKNLLTMGAGG